MKNRLIITVSDMKGTKSYNVHQFVKKILLSVVALIVVVIVGSFLFISYLNTSISKVKKEKELQLSALQKREIELKTKVEEYDSTIKQQIKDIEDLDTKLDLVHNITGVKFDKDASIEDISAQTIESLDLELKNFTLTVIPNGMPIEAKRRSSSYGYRINPVTKRRQFHKGVDFSAKMKTPVRATADGIVGYVQSRSYGDYGRMIRIHHSYGFQTIYAHLNKTLVKPGTIIRKGEIIGLSGNSGRSTGPHLHYEVKQGERILNPNYFVEWNLEKFDTIFKKERKVQWDSLVKLIRNHLQIKAQQ